MQLTSIIIPNYNGLKVLAPCIESIRKHVHTPYEIIVVDNGSTDGSAEYCLRQRVRLISLPFNKGFPDACNYGMLTASGDALLMLNNDTLLTDRALSNMLRCLFSERSIGIVGPISNYASGKQQMEEPFTTIDDMEKRYNMPNSAKWQEVNRLVGLCFLLKRELMDQIGLFDPRFAPGHYEDDDYCYRARQAGYRLMLAGDAFIYHEGSVSFAKESEERLKQLLETNRQKFIDKWGINPHEIWMEEA